MSDASDRAGITGGPLVQCGSTRHERSSIPTLWDLAWNCVRASVHWMTTWVSLGITLVFVSALNEEQISFDAQFSRLPISLATIVKAGAYRGLILGLVFGVMAVSIYLVKYGASGCISSMSVLESYVERAVIVILVVGSISGAYNMDPKEDPIVLVVQPT